MKRQVILYTVIGFFLFCSYAKATWPPPPPTAQTNATPKATKVPELRWFKGISGYEKAEQLQKETGADIFVVFYKENVPNEKGLYKWMKSKGFENSDVHNFLRDYIKVKIRLNKKKHRHFAYQQFNVNKTPATFVVWPSGWIKRCALFNWKQKRPTLLSADEIIQEIQKNSNPKKTASSPNQK